MQQEICKLLDCTGGPLIERGSLLLYYDINQKSSPVLVPFHQQKQILASKVKEVTRRSLCFCQILRWQEKRISLHACTATCWINDRAVIKNRKTLRVCAVVNKIQNGLHRAQI